MPESTGRRVRRGSWVRKPEQSRAFAALTACVTALMAAGSAGVVVGCGSKPTRRATPVEPIVRDVPAVLRGTVGTETTLRRIEPQLISGLGIVVGLNGTGGGELPAQVAAAMERELARGGIGRGAPTDLGALDGVTPRQFLRSPNVAVVVVEAAIPPGAPKGTSFDVRVRTLPGSSAVSLEGGVLWTTELRLGPATTVGQYRTHKIAEAKGPVFINPFAEPGQRSFGAGGGGGGADAVTRTVGRILDGGLITNSLDLQLVMDNESHARARSIVGAINSRFPEGPGDDGATAQGRTGGSVTIRVPRAYRDRTGEFLQLLRFTRIDQSFAQEYARRYVEELKRSPELADELSWCLQAVGKAAIPFVAAMYDYPELRPRTAALRAGARLGDARAAPHLRDLASGQGGTPVPLRLEAIELLGDMPDHPLINNSLLDLAGSKELEIRVAAYEALADRADPRLDRTPVAGKFFLDTVPVGDPLIYITQQGEPRIVLFGAGENGSGSAAPASISLAKPLLVSAWSDRLMLAADGPTDAARLYYLDHRTGKGVTHRAPESLPMLIAFMAHKPSPEDPSPGLDLTYSEVVGALHEIATQRGVGAAFATERDRLMAQLLKAAEVTVVADRPEVSEEEAGDTGDLPGLIFAPPRPAADAALSPAAPGEAAAPPSRVVPIVPAAPPPDGRGGSSR